MDYPAPVERLIDELRKLPGVGPKSAQRIAFHLLRGTKDDAGRLAEAIATLLDGIRTCTECNAVTDREVCQHCSDPGRSPRTICVVEEPHDVVAIEKTRDFKGVYHVLLGALSPLKGIGPQDIDVNGLLKRVQRGSIREVIVATNPNVEGEATALYIAQQLRPLEVRTTRLAFGLPVGGDLEYADQVTMSKALEGRREI